MRLGCESKMQLRRKSVLRSIEFMTSITMSLTFHFQTGFANNSKTSSNNIQVQYCSILHIPTHIHTLQLIPFFPRARQLLQLRGNGLCTSAVSGDCGRKNVPQMTSIDFEDLPRNTRNCQGDSTLRQFLPLSFERLILSPNSNCLSRSASSSGKADEGSFDMVPG